MPNRTLLLSEYRPRPEAVGYGTPGPHASKVLVCFLERIPVICSLPRVPFPSEEDQDASSQPVPTTSLTGDVVWTEWQAS